MMFAVARRAQEVAWAKTLLGGRCFCKAALDGFGPA